jgi:hypothetical protein
MSGTAVGDDGRASPDPAVTARCADSQPDEWSAGTMAAACGRAVEVLSRRTPASRVMARPDGTRELVEYAVPRWTRSAAGAWVPVDTSLRRLATAVAPVATVLPVRFSAGGDRLLARLADGARELALTWPEVLPVPELAGDSATYREVLPGVDLRVTATATGFTKVLVVKTRQAAANPALAAVRFGLTTNGVSVKAAKDGGLEARDASGRVVFTSPAPAMWDSTETASGMPRMAVMRERLEPGAVTVIPDRAFLTDPAVRYPVFLDPSWTGWWYMWKVVANRADVIDSSTFTLNRGATHGTAGSGRTCDESDSQGRCTSVQYLVRTMFRMDVSGVRGKHVLNANFNITQKWSWTCNPASLAMLWVTGGISPSTTWRTQPAWNGSYVAFAAASHRVDAAKSCAGTGTVSFDATAMVGLAISNPGQMDLTLGLRAADEGTTNHWKRVDAGTASLSITYNSVPNMPDTMTVQGQACATGAGRPVVAVGSPVLSARVTDPDGAAEGDIGGALRGDFAWERLDPATGTWSPLGSGSGTPQAGGATSPSPTPAFAHGTVYRWQARAANSYTFGVGGTDYSGWSGWCEFEVDTVRPNAPRLTPDAANQPFAAGRTIRLSLAAGGTPADTDVTGYSWWVMDGAGTHPPTFTTGATIDWTPIAGQGTIHVQAKDRIQVGTESTYVFNAAQAATEVVRWRLDEPAGSTTAADSTGHGHDASVMINAGSTLGSPGRLIGGPTALSLAGNSLAQGAAPLDTTRSFSVSTWVTLTDTSISRVAVSVLGPGYSAFYLMYHGDHNRWTVATPVMPDGPTTWIEAYSSGPPALGVWTHLTGVYDSASGHLRLYVDGQLTGTAGGAAIWSAPGPFQIGQVRGHSHWTGRLADVRVWDRVLSAAEIAAMSNPLARPEGGNVGQWHMDEGAGPTAFDSSDFFHDVNLNLSTGVSWTSGSQSGSAALAFDGSGEASTDGAVIHTDQSFTVSAWVRLADADPNDTGPTLPAGNRTVIGQSGMRISGFFLGYRIDADAPRWALSLPEGDSDFGDDPSVPGGWASALSAAPVTTADVGRWVHLVGVYDASTAAVRLYVDGVLVGSATRTGLRWDAPGDLTVGAAWWTGTYPTPRVVDHWIGSIDNVNVYQGAVPAALISSIP